MKPNQTAARVLLTLAQLEASRDVLRFLCAESDQRKSFIRLHLLAWLLGASTCRTQRELGVRMNLTEARVSQMLRVFKRQFGKSALFSHGKVDCV